MGDRSAYIGAGGDEQAAMLLKISFHRPSGYNGLPNYYNRLPN